jgi:hypothetical protein
MGGLLGLKTHVHREQQQPRKRGWSIHTSLRGIEGIKAKKKKPLLAGAL